MTPDIQQQLLAKLAVRLEGASIRRSAVETVVCAVGGGEALRAQVDHLLAEASICVVEDVPLQRETEPDPAGAPAPSANRDPVEVARRRLELDRGCPPGRLAKILLTAEEEVGLTLLARPNGQPLEQGGFAGLDGEARQAAEAMVLHNLGLIHSVAQRMTRQGLDYDDLTASGIPGLLRAIELFDPFRGLKFSTYAMHWVRQSIGRAVDDEARLIRLPVYVCESIRSVRAAQERLTVDGHMPRWEDLARECHISVEKVGQLLRLAPAVISLETPVGNDGTSLGDLLDRPTRADDPIEVQGLFPEDCEPLLLELKPREADVIRMRFGLTPFNETHTLDEIGKVYGVTRERIRQIESKAMTGLRKALTRHGHPFDFSEQKKKQVKDDVTCQDDNELAQSA